MNTDNLKKEIKKVRVGHIALLCTGIFLAFAIIGSILLATGGAFSTRNGLFHIGDYRNIGIGQLYDVNDHGEQDMAGVEKVIINTVSDTVTLQSGGDKAVADLVGQCRSATGPVKLETRKQGSTVYIEVKYPMSSNSNSTSLTVTLPVDYLGDLSISTVSGDIRAEGLPFKLQQVNLGTVSGRMDFTTASYTRLKANTTSGDVVLAGIVGETSVSTISGRVELDYAAFAATTVGTVSGDVSATIPQDAAFKVDFGSVSGDFTSRHPGINVDRAKSGFNGTAAGGTSPIKVNTTSGNFRIDGK